MFLLRAERTRTLCLTDDRLRDLVRLVGGGPRRRARAEEDGRLGAERAGAAAMLFAYSEHDSRPSCGRCSGQTRGTWPLYPKTGAWMVLRFSWGVGAHGSRISAEPRIILSYSGPGVCACAGRRPKRSSRMMRWRTISCDCAVTDWNMGALRAMAGGCGKFACGEDRTSATGAASGFFASPTHSNGECNAASAPVSVKRPAAARAPGRLLC